MFVVYSDNQTEKKHLEEEFLFQSNFFAVPISNAKSLHDLVDKTCYEFYQKHQSIFIQKLKIFISGLLDLNFSFPLLRQLLSMIKKKDLVTDLYRNHLISINKFFLQQDQNQNLFSNTDSNQPKQYTEDQFQKVLISHKTFELIDIDTQPLLSLGSFGQYEQFLKDKMNEKNADDKISLFQSARTNDETLQQFYHGAQIDHRKSKQLHDKVVSAFTTPSKQQINVWHSPTSSTFFKTPQITSKKSLDSSIQNFMNSFKKIRPSGIVEMFLNDDSIGKVAKKQRKIELQRRRLEQQLIQKTRTVKSNQYNKNIKNVIMNKKLKDRKKPKASGQVLNSKLSSNVVNAYELRRVSSQIVHCPSENQSRWIKSDIMPN